jgi:hypothetical protein
MAEAEIRATPVKRDWALKLADALRSTRDFADRARVPESVPLLGGMGAGEILLGQSPEGFENVAYGMPMTTGKGWTTRLKPETIDMGFLGLDALGVGQLAKAGAKPLAKAAAREINEAMLDGTGPLGKALSPVAPSFAVAPGKKGLTSVRSAIEQADSAIKESKRAGGKGIIVNKAEELKVLPKTDSPYIEADQFLPDRQSPRMKGGEPVYNERTADLLEDPAARRAIERNILRGDAMGMREWYGTKPLYEAAMDAGQTPDEFARMMQHLSSASQRSPVPGQIKRGSATWVADKQGLLTPDAPEYKLPPGYGSLAQKQIIENAYKIAGGEGLDTSKKLGRFNENLTGNLEPVTVDVMAMRGPIMATKDPRWLARELREQNAKTGEISILRPREMFEKGEISMADALQRPGFWEAAPQGAEYGAFEDMYRNIAKKRGMAPAEAQANAWYGSGADAGLRSAPRTFMQAVEDRIIDTAGKRNETYSQVLADFLRGKKPLMGVGAGVGLGAGEESELLSPAQ